MRYAACCCGMRYVMCGMLCAVCGMRYAVGGVAMWMLMRDVFLGPNL